MACPSDPPPDSERIPTPDESGVRVVGPTYEVRVGGKVVATFVDFMDAYDESNRIGSRAGAQTWRVDKSGECLLQSADGNALDEARREAGFFDGATGKPWMTGLSKRTAEKIARGEI